MTIFYSEVEPLSKYYPVTLHLSPATRILNENPASKVNHKSPVKVLFHLSKTILTFCFLGMLLHSLIDYLNYNANMQSLGSFKKK